MLDCKQRNLQNRKKSQLYNKVELSRTTRPVPSGGVEEKEIIFKKKRERKRKIPCVYIWVQTKRAVQHLHDEFQIENINKNYGHANVQASDKFVMRMRKWLTKRKMFRIVFFLQTANAAQLCRKGGNSTLFSKCSFTEPQTFVHSSALLLRRLRVRGYFSSPPPYPHDASLLYSFPAEYH